MLTRYNPGVRRPATPRPELELTLTAASGKPYVPYLRRHLAAAHAWLKPALAELSVALVGDKRMADLHLQFLGIPGPTDVLTFPLDEDARGRVTAAEIVVCVSEARRRAKQEGTEVRKELLLYALHGMLHLCGFDDRTDRGFAAMHRTEDQILTALGVGAVFASRADAMADARTNQPPGSSTNRRASRARKSRPSRASRGGPFQTGAD